MYRSILPKKPPTPPATPPPRTKPPQPKIKMAEAPDQTPKGENPGVKDNDVKNPPMTCPDNITVGKEVEIPTDRGQPIGGDIKMPNLEVDGVKSSDKID
ncbi:hypothetical protein [Ninorex virus]|nr:hypothetical protein [Ninorex virus]